MWTDPLLTLRDGYAHFYKNLLRTNIEVLLTPLRFIPQNNVKEVDYCCKILRFQSHIFGQRSGWNLGGT